MATRLAVIGTGVLAIACCIGVPAVGAALGGMTVGVAAGLMTAAVLGVAGVLLVRGRRERTRTDCRR